jgi:hypothetical protein
MCTAITASALSVSAAEENADRGAPAPYRNPAVLDREKNRSGGGRENESVFSRGCHSRLTIRCLAEWDSGKPKKQGVDDGLGGMGTRIPAGLRVLFSWPVIFRRDAYVYGYPLVTMEMTRRVMTNVAAPRGNRGPMGQFVKVRQYPDASSAT